MKLNCPIVWLSEIEKEDQNFVGEKAALLAELQSLRINLPQGFVITSHAYSLFIEFNHLKRKIKDLLSMLDPKHPVSLQTASEKIKSLFQKGSLPFELAQEIINAYFELGSPFKDALTALRSSAIGPKSSLLQTATHLNVKGEANLIESLKICWSSLFSPENVRQTLQKKESLLETKMAILVQKMVQSKNSGVIFTKDLVENKKNVIIIKAIYGLGLLGAEAEVDPDLYSVNKQNFEILTKEIKPQTIELRLKGDDNEKVKVSQFRQKKQKINDRQIIKLAKIGTRIQDYYYFPQEIEWGIEKDKVFIFQSKPIE